MSRLALVIFLSASACFQCPAAPPGTVSPAEERILLTPDPPRRPRINYPKIFGVRPGSPLLFAIPATGDRPMRFSARDLPEGVRLDPNTGQLRGTVARRGSYRVWLRAENAFGADASALRIVCGDELALTPHMGWNSWYIWESHVTDAIIRAAADAMVRSGLAAHGYSYVNIDDCWAVKVGSNDPELGGPPRDAQGRIRANRHFPDMKSLTDYIHGLGLKAGIYTSPGPTTCGGYEGAFGHEEADARQFVEWGFDFLKYDWCSYSSVEKPATLEALQRPYRVMSAILKKQPRDVVFNLCQYGMGRVWEWGRAVGGNSWRTAGDLGGSFQGIPKALFRDGFDLYSRWHLDRHAGPGGWNDPDYLLFGYLSNWKGGQALTPLTPNEQYTQMSLWCLVAAPLILSGDITRLDRFTLSLLSNDEVIAVDQDALGRPGRRLFQQGSHEVWMKELEDGSRAIGLFNRGETAAPIRVEWNQAGWPNSAARVRDLWRQKDLGEFRGGYQALTPPHGVVFIRIFDHQNSSERNQSG